MARRKLSTFEPDPKVYQQFGVDPRVGARRDPAKEKQLHGLLDNQIQGAMAVD